MPVPEVVSMPGAESTRKASKLPKFDGSSWTPHKKQALHHGSWSVSGPWGVPGGEDGVARDEVPRWAGTTSEVLPS